MCALITDVTGNNLTYRIIGAAMAVHNALGRGYKEEVYERALFIELQERDIVALRQHRVEVWYAESLAATLYLDLYVEEQVVVEVKAFPHLLTGDERGQVIGYLKATQAPVGLLLNFGRHRLEYQRLFPGPAGQLPRRLARDDHRGRRH